MALFGPCSIIVLLSEHKKLELAAIQSDADRELGSLDALHKVQSHLRKPSSMRGAGMVKWL